MRACIACGTSIEHRDPRAKVCSEACRKRAKRAEASGAVLPTSPEATELASDVPSVASGELMTLHELAAELSTRLRSSRTPPSAKVGLARELRATLDAIERAKPAEVDPLTVLEDDLARKRAERGVL